MAARDNVRFVADFFSEFLESRLNDGQLTTRRYHRLLEQIEADADRRAQGLFRRGNSHAKYRDSVYTLRYLREPNRRLFPFILAVPRKSGRRAIKCFVGHRFTKAVVWSLRYNLKHLFEPYRIDLDWSGDDLAAYRRTTLGTGTVPTDLAALLTVRYRDYNHLCRQLYFKLPRFLERHRLV